MELLFDSQRYLMTDIIVGYHLVFPYLKLTLDIHLKLLEVKRIAFDVERTHSKYRLDWRLYWTALIE